MSYNNYHLTNRLRGLNHDYRQKAKYMAWELQISTHTRPFLFLSQVYGWLLELWAAFDQAVFPCQVRRGASRGQQSASPKSGNLGATSRRFHRTGQVSPGALLGTQPGREGTEELTDTVLMCLHG